MSLSLPNKAEGSKMIARLMIAYAKFFAPLIFLSVAAIGYFFIISPRYQEIQTKINEVNEKKKTELDNLKQDLNSLQKYKIAFDKLDQEKIDRINKMIPSMAQGEYQTEDLFSELEILANSQGLVLGSVTIDAGKKSSQKGKGEDDTVDAGSLRVGKTNLTVNLLAADYKNVKAIINIFEHNLRLMDINQISYNPETHAAVLSMTVYYLK